MSEYVNPVIGVDTDGNNNVRLTVWTDLVDREVVHLSLSPDCAASLLRDLTGQATYALTRSAMAIARGDCPTCKNTRMVARPHPGGREWSEHCPDCEAATTSAGYPLRPQIGGGLA